MKRNGWVKQDVGARPSTEEGIYLAICNAILEQRLPPGTRLTEESLAEIFSVTRGAVRKVLLRLTHDNVVEIRPNRGASVVQPSPEEARNVFEARRVIESAVVAKAASVVGPTEIAALRRLVEKDCELAEQGDRQLSIRLSGEFHIELARMAGNEIHTRFVRELVSLTSLVIALYETPGTSACRHNDHFEVLDAIAAGDADLSVRLMREHLDACERRVNLQPEDGAAVDLRQVFAPPREAAEA